MGVILTGASTAPITGKRGTALRQRCLSPPGAFVGRPPRLETISLGASSPVACRARTAMTLARSGCSKCFRHLQRWALPHVRQSRSLGDTAAATSSSAGVPPLRFDLTPRKDDDSLLKTRFASVAVVGFPSAGKSSLMNRLVGGRVSAVSRKVQTTRRRIVGMLTEGDAQLALLDTPGVIQRRFTKDLGAERKQFARDAWGAIADADVTLFVVDISRDKGHWFHAAALANDVIESRLVSSQLPADVDSGSAGPEHSKPPFLLALNKADSVRPKSKVLEAAGFFADHINDFTSVVHDARPLIVSAYTGRGVESVKQELLRLAPGGEFLMSRHQSPAGFEDAKDTVLEHIWQAALHRLHHELPYRIQFETDSWKILSNGNIAASFILRAGRQSHLPMIIGHRGHNIRFIAEEAGASASEILGRQVYLSLRVAVKKGGNR